MKPPAATVVDDERIRESLRRLVGRLGGEAPVVVSAEWRSFASALGLSDRSGRGATVYVGPIEDALAARPVADFGFVAPAARYHRVWERESTRFADPTMRLWRGGWSPQNVDRIVVATDDGDLELAIGDARQTPTVLSSAMSAFDDAD